MRRSADQPSTRPRRGRLAAAALALGLTGALAAAGPSLAGPSLAGSNPVAQLTVSPAQPMATVPGTAIGINGSTYDSSLLDHQVPGLLRNAGISLVRVPGGSESDQYDWKTSTDVIGNFREAVDFDQFMSVIRQAGGPAADGQLQPGAGAGVRGPGRRGTVRAMVVNDDPSTSYDLGLTVPGYHLTAAPVLFYGAQSFGTQSSAVQTLTGAQARAAAATVPPYSITMLTLARD